MCIGEHEMILNNFELVDAKISKGVAIALEVRYNNKISPFVSKHIEFYFYRHIDNIQSKIYIRALVNINDKTKSVWCVIILNKLPNNFNSFINTFFEEYVYNEEPIFEIEV